MYLIMNNLDIFRKNIELISTIRMSDNIVNEFKNKLISYLSDDKFFDRKKIQSDDFEKKFGDLISNINLNSPIKIISDNKSENEILVMINETIDQIKKIELRKRIESLEDKVSSNLDESLYSELLSLRSQLKSG